MKIRRRLWIIPLAVAAIPAMMVADVQVRYVDRITTSDATMPPTNESGRTAIVLGASIRSDGTPSPALKDRLDEGAHLYDRGSVRKIFLTGDDGAYHADEISVMKPYLLQHGVPEEDLIVDGKGYRTFESCKHAKERGITPAIIVTQRFHIARALYLCNTLGVDAIGVPSDGHAYTDIAFFWLRDLAASLEAWWDTNVMAPKPPVG